MALLHELLAVEPDAQAAALNSLDEGIITFSKRQDHFLGQSVDVKYLSESRKGEDVSSSKEIVTTVDAKIDYIANGLARLWDVKFQKDTANNLAKADLIIDGKTIATNVPSIWLLNMETHLKKVRELLLAIPTLEPAIRWDLDSSLGKGVYRAPVATTMRTEKVIDHKVLVAATDKHPAQVEKWTEDRAVARVETTRFSGMWSVARKSEVLGKLDTLLAAIKQARMRANLVEVPKVEIGKKLTEYLFS